LLALKELGDEKGYTLICTTTFNGIFLRNDLMKYMPLGVDTSSLSTDTLLNSLHNCSMCTEMFQTYDGELRYTGTLKLLWHKIALNPQQLQVLPKHKRIFPFAPPQESTANKRLNNFNNRNNINK
jgi:hypothetical protein